MSQKQEISEEARTALSFFRLHRAKETLREAGDEFAAKSYSAALEHLHDACHFAVIALLRKNSIPAQTYKEVMQMFSTHFIATGKIPEHHFTFYRQLYDDRLSVELNRQVEFDAEAVRLARPQAEAFVGVIEAEFAKYPGPPPSFVRL